MLVLIRVENEQNRLLLVYQNNCLMGHKENPMLPAAAKLD